MKRSAGLGCAFVLLSAAGCSDSDPCTKNLKEGETFSVEVLSKTDPTLVALPTRFEGLPSCNGFDSVEVGGRHTLTLDDHPNDGTQCYDFDCPVNFPTPAESMPYFVGKPNNEYVCVNGESKITLSSSCEAGRFVALYRRTAGGMYGPLDDSGTSEVILLRALTLMHELECTEPPEEFADATPSTRFFCADQWNVQLTPATK